MPRPDPRTARRARSGTHRSALGAVCRCGDDKGRHKVLLATRGVAGESARSLLPIVELGQPRVGIFAKRRAEPRFEGVASLHAGAKSGVRGAGNPGAEEEDAFLAQRAERLPEREVSFCALARQHRHGDERHRFAVGCAHGALGVAQAMALNEAG
eukprot:5732637-Prymnesium_polylepis.1